MWHFPLFVEGMAGIRRDRGAGMIERKTVVSWNHLIRFNLFIIFHRIHIFYKYWIEWASQIQCSTMQIGVQCVMQWECENIENNMQWFLEIVVEYTVSYGGNSFVLQLAPLFSSFSAWFRLSLFALDMSLAMEVFCAKMAWSVRFVC